MHHAVLRYDKATMIMEAIMASREVNMIGGGDMQTARCASVAAAVIPLIS